MSSVKPKTMEKICFHCFPITLYFENYAQFFSDTLCASNIQGTIHCHYQMGIVLIVVGAAADCIVFNWGSMLSVRIIAINEFKLTLNLLGGDKSVETFNRNL